MKRALCIGLNYTGSDYELGGCVNDATANRDRLLAKGVTVDMRTDSISVMEFVDLLSQLRSKQKASDTLYITYSGHGTQIDGTEHDGNEALCFYKNGEIEVLPDFYLQKELALFKGTVVLILDSCFSGGMAKAFKPHGGGKKSKFIHFNADTMAVVIPPQHKSLAAKAVSNKRYNLFACEESEVSWDLGTNGLFTAEFMKAYDAGTRTIGKLMGKAYDKCSPDQHPTMVIVNGAPSKRLF